MFQKEEVVHLSDWDAERVTLGRHFIRDLEGLWGGVLKLAAVVEDALNQSVRALCDGRTDLADEVRSEERDVDRLEVQIERDCLKVLALHQPVASDLRRVASVLKVNGELERISNLARNIAKRVKKLAADPRMLTIPREMESLALEVLDQFRASLDALSRCDAALARTVIAGDGRVDRHFRIVLRELKDEIRRDPDRLNTWLRLINTTRNLERIADHATKIAEAVVYMKEGDIIRHLGAEVASRGGTDPRPQA
ncbi:MAG: phosphate signaling complex protein PhoU [Planctomycetaceae bacterium]|nr:phosphate signaling complex protein PhoU [Planctomycetaceae bacterium]